MKRLLWLLLAAVLFVVVTDASPSEPLSSEPCGECHLKEWAEYSRSRMATAARTPAFLKEWQLNGKDARCLECHAPNRQEGVSCVDCHGADGHPYQEVEVPQICARCHDAPGELTVRSFIGSPAARQGRDCLSCHLTDVSGGHDFIGPTRAGFLADVAKVKLSVRRDADGYAALIRVGHRAGHALPGGTTGRSVWLVVDELDGEGMIINRTNHRFGWFHDSKEGWLDRRIPPGQGKSLEIPLLSPDRAAAVTARLIYRFVAGGIELSDPDQVVLDHVRFALKRE